MPILKNFLPALDFRKIGLIIIIINKGEGIAMEERTGLVSLQGNPLTLLGPEIKVGDQAPEFEVLDNNLSPIRLDSFKGKIIILASVPSLDTPVCDLETRRFNAEAGKLHPDVRILTISMDLPFAQKRWCGAAGVDKVVTLSDHRTASFGSAYGVLIKELRLLARAVFVLDREGVIRYIQVLPDLALEPDYDQAIKAVEKLV
jgi:thiol peroxidase